MHIGKRLKKFRQQYRYSQGRFAVLVGVTQPYLSALENETAQPSKELIARIEKAILIVAEAEKAATEARTRVLANLVQ